MIKFNSNFEIENILYNNVYKYNQNKCETLSITNSLNKADYSLFLGCDSEGVLYKDDLPGGFAPQTLSPEIPTTLTIESTLLQEISTISTTSEISTMLTTSKIEAISTVKTDTEKYTLILNEPTQMAINSFYSTEFSSIPNNTNAEIIFGSTEITKDWNSNQYSDRINTSKAHEYNTYYNPYHSFMDKSEICSEDFFYQNILTNECLYSCSSEYLQNKICKINIVTNSNINEITNDIRNLIPNENITSDTNIIIEGVNSIYQIISNKKMSENENTNISIIDLGECEQKLLEIYELDYLLILKIDTKLDDNTIVILNYEVYDSEGNEKLNLSLCHNIKITTYYTYYPSKESISKINQLSESGYDLYDPNGDFYQDLCSPFTSEDYTDILLSDRKKDFYENISLCENECTYKGYNLETKRVQCECSVKEEITLEEEEQKNNILEDFFDESSFSNIKLLKCFNLVFSTSGQKNNIGSIMFLIILLCLIICCIIYGINKEKYIIRNITKINNEKYKKNLKFNISNTLNNIEPRMKDKDIVLFPPKKRKKKNQNNNKSKVIFNYINNNNNFTNSINNLEKKNESNFQQKFDPEKNKNKNETQLNYNMHNFINEELNSLSYDLAFNYDKRTYFQYYISLLKQKHLILFTFCNNQDYNIFILKLSLLLSSFSLYFAVNSLFFNDDTMHDLYEKRGDSGIISQISNIFYSTIISCFINIIIKKLGLSHNDMVKIKHIPNSSETLKHSTFLMKKLKIQFGIFFLIIFLLVSFFWYFIAAFCAVYRNTQKILIENTISSFCLSLLYPFGLNLIPGMFRIPSLKNYTSSSKYCYFISKIIALI